MPRVDGHRIVDAVQRDRLGTRVLLLSGALDSAAAFAALEAGDDGVLSKTAEVSVLLDALLASVIDPELTSGVVSDIRSRSVDHRPVRTDREAEILSRIADGHSIPEMARVFQRSPSTVKTHVDHLNCKLGVSDRAAAGAAAMRSGPTGRG